MIARKNAISTRSMTREQWLEARKPTIGTSDMPAVCGFGRHTPSDQFDFMTGAREPEDLSDNIPVQIGLLSEPMNHRLYERETGRRIHKINEMRYHADLPFVHATLDRVTYGDKRVVELKNTGEFPGRAGYGGAEDADDLPPAVLIQVQAQLAVYEEYPVADVSVIIGGNRHRVIPVYRDEEMIGNILRIAREFYDYVERGERPPPITYAEACAAFPQHVEQPIEADEATVEAFTLYRNAKANSSEIESLQLQIATYLGARDTLTIGGQPVLTWRSQSAKRLDQSLLKAAEPELYAHFTRESSSRVMRLKGKA